MDKEIYSPNEFQSLDEFQSFKAEQYNVKEHIKQNMEDFKVPEIKQSSLDNLNQSDSKANIQDEINKIKDAGLKSGGAATGSAAGATGSAAAGAASIGTAASLVVTAVAGTSVVLGTNILDPKPQEPVEPPIVLPLYGEIAYQNALIDYHLSNDETMTPLQNITFYMSGNINDGYKAEIVNENTNKTATMQSNKIILNDIPEQESEFILNFKNNDDEVIESFPISVPNYNVFKPENGWDFAYCITANSDDTINLYHQFKTNYDADFFSQLQIQDLETTEILNYDVNVCPNYSYIENMPFKNFALNFKPYVLFEGNKYSYGYPNDAEPVHLQDMRVFYEAIDDKLKVTYYDFMVNDMVLDITFDDGSSNTFTLTKDMFDVYGEAYINLGKISKTLDIKLTVDQYLPNKFEQGQIPQDLANIMKGENHKIMVSCQHIDTQITDILKIKDVILTSPEYVDLNTDTSNIAPMIINFEGRLKDEKTSFGIEVKDSLGNIISEHQNEEFKDLSKPILFKRLLNNETYTFTYYIKDNKGRTDMGTAIYKPGERPADLSYGEGSVGVYPSGCYVTYNSDNTYNIYDYVELYNPDSVDMYYLVDFIDINNPNKSIKSYLGKDMIKFENIPMELKLKLKVEILQKVGNIYYSIARGYNDPNEIGIFPNDKGFVEIRDVGIDLTRVEKEIEIRFSNVNIQGDLNVNYKVDNEVEKTLLVNNADIIIDPETQEKIIKIKLDTQVMSPREIIVKVMGNYDPNEELNSDIYLNEQQLTYKGLNTLPFVSNLKYTIPSTM